MKEVRKRTIAVLVVLILASVGVWAKGSNESKPNDRAVGEPQYGGTLTYDIGGDGNEPPSPSNTDAQFNALRFLEHMQEHPLAGDVERYGTRGSGEYPFEEYAYIPEQYLKGHLLEDWEVSYEKMVWHVRPGIHWAPTETQKAWMEPRELTAEDMAADIRRFMDSAWNVRFKGIANSSGVRVIDKYTLEIEFEEYSPMLQYYLALEDRSLYSAPETEIAGPDRWENQVGTGAFMFEEYIPGSHMSFVRNPNYWGKTTIDGVEYQMPFIDRVVCPIIIDASTRVAALRTGKLDLGKAKAVSPTFASSLTKVSGLIHKKLQGAFDAKYINFRCNEPPFDNRDVRRAMMIGTNMDQFMALGMSPSEQPWFPTFPWNPAHVPMNELPETTQQLFKYNPELAKKMLADAGYPNGFETTLTIDASIPAFQDRASLLKDQWARIGVDVSIDALESVEYNTVRYPIPSVTYHGVVNGTYSSADPLNMLDSMCRTGGGLNYSNYSNPELDTIIADAMYELDSTKRNELIKDAAKMVLSDAMLIPLHFDPPTSYWWPWVRNYDGESSLQDDNCFAQLINYMWIDQDLKKEMGY